MPELARRMLERAHTAGLPAAWVTGDTVYGGHPPLRGWLEEQRQPYVLAIAANDGVDLPAGDQTSMHVLPRKIAEYALGTLMETLIAVAGRRWTIEESLEAAKGEVGLDHYEVRHLPSPRDAQPLSATTCSACAAATVDVAWAQR